MIPRDHRLHHIVNVVNHGAVVVDVIDFGAVVVDVIDFGAVIVDVIAFIKLTGAPTGRSNRTDRTDRTARSLNEPERQPTGAPTGTAIVNFSCTCQLKKANNLLIMQLGLECFRCFRVCMLSRTMMILFTQTFVSNVEMIYERVRLIFFCETLNFYYRSI